MTEETKDKPVKPNNRLLWIVTSAFVIQILVWSVFFYFAQKSAPEFIPTKHTSKTSAPS